MTTTRRVGWAAAVVLAATAGANAQVPGGLGGAPAVPVAPAVPGAPPLPGGGVGGAGVAPIAAAGGGGGQANIWGFFMMTPEQKAQCRLSLANCRTRFCASRFGQMANGLLLQAGPLTGGMLGPLCPIPNGPNGVPVGGVNPADLNKPPGSPERAAALIKAEEDPAVIKAKVAAVQFLGTVDCRYYPEAEAGLITGLRAEKNECVRLAAAKALATGCCCSPKIIKALLMVVNCSNKDGFPAEASEAVRAFAFVALERCLRRCVEVEPEPPPEPPPAAKAALLQSLTPLGPTADASTHVLLASYFPAGGGEPAEKVYAEAREALGRGLKLSPETVARLSGPRNVTDGVGPITLPTVAMPRLVPDDLAGRLKAVVMDVGRGPRERTVPFITTLPRRPLEPAIVPEPIVYPSAGPVVPLPPTAATPYPTSRPVPVSVTAGPATADPPPRPKTSVMSLWKDATRR